MKKGLFLLGALVTFLGSTGYARDIEPCKEGPVHEAYMVKEVGEVILQAIHHAPPPRIEEKIPPQSDEQTEWIPGYWDWSKVKEDFIWVSGTWRRSPPGQEWTPGKWKQYQEGWVRLSGFWTATSLEDLKPITEPPPDQIDEKVPPAPSDDYFWIPGYWSHDAKQDKYIWYSGRWERFNDDWILVPAHYVWRPQGYLFIPSYWDWPLDQRGVAYACVYINPSARDHAAYLPNVVLEPLAIVEACFPCYPCYLCFYHFHYHYHHDFWVHWGAAPPWWGWNSWWCYTWFDQFGLWWWWCHPGFPHPFWLNVALAQQIGGPPQFVINMMKKSPPPLIVSPNGIIPPDRLLEEGEDSGMIGKNPIFPTDPNQIKEIQEEALKKPLPPILRPRGPKKPDEKGPLKPNFGPEEEDLATPPHRVTPPQLPIKPPLGSPIKKPKKPRKPVIRPTPQPRPRWERPHPRPRPQEELRPRPTPQPQPRSQPQPRPRPEGKWRPHPEYQPAPRPRPETKPRPRPQPDTDYAPRPSKPYQPPTQSEIPQTTTPPTYQPSTPQMPNYQRQRSIQPQYQRRITPQIQPRYQQRSQKFSSYTPTDHGQLPDIEHPPLPRAQQDLGNKMNRPSPQVNPGPSSQYPEGFRGNQN